MINTTDIHKFCKSAACLEKLSMLYGRDENKINAQVGRYAALGERFAGIFPHHRALRFFSAPGRAEIGGNHTDHQSGRVLTASIHLDTLAAVAPNGSSIVRIHSEGFPPAELDLSSLDIQDIEKGTAAALIRGCAFRLKALGYQIGGFDAAITSDVLPGSGLSSSAALEILFCAILDGLFNQGDISPVERAKIGQFAENRYFGKPCGLLDQMGSSFGGLVAIDFQEEEPSIETISFDFAAHGYALAIVNTGGDHGDLTDHYAAIPAEMKQVAAFFGCERLRSVSPERFDQAIPALRAQITDRPILRAMHFFEENDRVPQQVDALKACDLPRFFALIQASGESSIKLLQNIHAKADEQPLSLALELSHQMLRGRGAWRVHGGGFAGTILAFVPLDMMDAYVKRMDSVFGSGACVRLNVRPVGAYELKENEEGYICY